MEDVTNRIVSYLDENISNSSGGNTNALVRFYKIHPYKRLHQGLQGFAQGILGSAPSDDTNCLTMLATNGKMTAGNPNDLTAADPIRHRRRLGHEARPMLIGDMSEKTYNTFYVPESVGSPSIPTRDDFVIPNGIKLVLGFGGVLSSGELFVVIMSSKVSIPGDAVNKFSTTGAGVKEAVEPFVGNKVFAYNRDTDRRDHWIEHRFLQNHWRNTPSKRAA